MKPETENLLKRLVSELDEEMNRVYTEYTELHKELDRHRGKVIDETNGPVINQLIQSIQDKFAELYPAYHFIAHRHQYVVNATNSFTEFLEQLKKAGAHEIRKEKDERKIIIH